MSYEEDKARALARVRKMLALANDAAATEGERENALRMAHATLAKYNLELAEAVERGDARVMLDAIARVHALQAKKKEI